MAKVRLSQQEFHAPWQADEIVTVKVLSVDGDGIYTCETLETYPPDLKERHADEIKQMQADHAETVATLRMAITQAEPAPDETG